MNESSVTKEYLAGASGLDGEDLTLALLHENETLILQNADYRRQNSIGYWVWMGTLAALILSLLIR